MFQCVICKICISLKAKLFLCTTTGGYTLVCQNIFYYYGDEIIDCYLMCIFDNLCKKATLKMHS